MELIPALPEELGLECLTRLPYTAHRVATQVCRQWSQLLRSQEFYYHRKKYGYTEKLACLVQAFPAEKTIPDAKPASSPSYGLTVFDPVSQTWERLDPVPKYPNGLPLFCQPASCEGKLIVMGGWNPASYDPVRGVFVYDFTTQGWTQGKDMPSKRSFFAVGAIGSKVYVAGGHDENKNALKSVWAYDVSEDEWVELTQMSQERDECEGVVIGNKFWAVSGYKTEAQGEFESSCESYQLDTGDWSRVEGVWKPGKCPRSCVGVGNDGKPASWPESNSGAGEGAIGIKMDELVILKSGSADQEFFLGKMDGAKIDKLKKLEVPNEFSGLVQSGCFVEI
ncbi:F-box/kelch-repeat protein At2g44130-like [Coffea eugenioides]|uniref:F-box/kelch-repeat protein At2g44130-like n=1 Tax=Coffea eugenioides TaxID=49369 RepID=UPI000F60EA94|nr:F-box/kelch-repeat protein At2g44130-like [Coffea eugenioides]